MSHVDNNISDEISVTTEFDLDGLMIDYFNNLPDSPTGTAASKIYRGFTSTPEPLPFHSHGSNTEYDTSEILDGGGFESPEAWRLTNGVHMEVQENAKISTVNYNIDRSNSTTNFHRVPQEIQHYVLRNSTYETNKNKTPSTTPPSEVDVTTKSKSDSPLSMGFFLRKEGERGTRGSFNLNYANVGVLKNDMHSQRYHSSSDVSNNAPTSEQQALENLSQAIDNSKHDLYVPYLKGGGHQTNSQLPTPPLVVPATEQSVRVPSNQNERNSSTTINDLNTINERTLLELTGGIEIDPTPLSEIKRRHSPKPWPSTNQSTAPVKSILVPNATSGFQFYVPRPTKPKAVPNPVVTLFSQTTINHVNPTVLASAKVAEVSTSIPRPALTTTPGLFEKIVPSTIEMNKVPHHHDHLRTMSRPKLISNGGINSFSVQNEQMKKSQYGFGSKHVVPSVPVVKTSAPKRPSKTYTRRNSGGKNQQPTSASLSPGTQLQQKQPRSPTKSETLEGSSAHGGNHEAAYERKKARAKNARVMINDSIDRLSVVLSAAGTQSKERGEQLIRMKQEKQQSLKTIRISNDIRSGICSGGSNGINNSSNNAPVSNSTNMQNSITRCIDISVSAKKWDRPGFIGSAASMIQALNDHCESLMHELVTYHGQNMNLIKYFDHTKTGSSLASGKKSSNNEAVGDVTLNGVQCGKHSLNDTINSDCVEKRARILAADDNNKALLLEITKTEVISAVLAERKVMNYVMQYLTASTKLTCLLKVSKSWKNGNAFDTVTLWNDLCTTRFGPYNTRQWMDKIDMEQTDVSEQRRQLYQSMSSFESLYWQMNDANVMPRFSKTSNIFYLGEGKIPGKALAWTFVVDRSNGETMRTVRCQPDSSRSTFDEKQQPTRYTSMPVVQLWTIVQNIALDETEQPLIIRDQPIIIDASTRRRKDEMVEITWDDRLQKRILDLDGNPKSISPTIGSSTRGKELCRLSLFEAAIIETSIHAKGCGTTSKFIQKSNYTQILIQVPIMTTVPLVIPFPRDSSHLPNEFDLR